MINQMSQTRFVDLFNRGLTLHDKIKIFNLM